MSIAATLPPRSEAPTGCRHPNELDLRRVERALAERVRYRYVRPTVVPVEEGYLVRAACCSRNVDPAGGEIDIALLRWEDSPPQWLLLRKDHKAGSWIEDSRYARLAELFLRLNADPDRKFWQ